MNLNKNKFFFFGLLLPLVVIFLLAMFFVDVGINNSYYIKRDFNKAFLYRTTGNCEAFVKYINKDQDSWRSKCEEEKLTKSGQQPIKSFKIVRISHDLLSDKSFLQVEIVRRVGLDKDSSYVVNYEMRRIGILWKIDQEINK